MGHFLLPKVKLPREAQQEEFLRKLEIDPAKYYPPDVNRPMVTEMPSVVDIIKDKIQGKVEGAEETVEGWKKKIQEYEQKIKNKLEGK